ncbi:MAG: YceI family protein [Bryobacterales bacterium]|nr:YceI family protein [Bryobacterales bacterium]
MSAIALLGFALFAGPAAYQIEPADHTHIVLEVYKTGLMSGKTHHFEFARYHGTLWFDSESPDRSKVDLTIEVDSIECKDTWINEKDQRKVTEAARDKNMLDVEHFPEIRFVSKRVNPKGRDAFEVEGVLSIREMPKPLTMQVQLKHEGGRMRLTGEAEVKLSDYDLKPPTALLGAAGTKDEMKVQFNVVAER